MNNKELMNLAIESMLESKTENRDDGKISPKVGAVIVKKDGSINKAHRGELRCGDHAEYTLLDRKNVGSDLTDATMFVTLEPCAPGSRSCRKTSCAERIVNARISKVYVACEDPDPKVSRAGIDYLQKNKVEVIMFDKELQEIVLKENDDFFKQCYERAKEAKQKQMLTKIDEFKTQLNMDILSEKAIEYYCEKSSLNKSDFESALRNLGLISDNKFNDQAILLFGKKPREYFPQAGVKIILDFGGVSNFMEFDEPLILIADKIQSWYNTLPKITNRNELTRIDKEIYPFEVIREAIINAIVHRDYDIEGAKITITIDEQKISVKSPGQPVKGISFEQIKDFSAPSLSRNPKISYLFNRVKQMEETGLGMRTFKEVPFKYNLPLPIYSFDGVNIVLDLFFNENSRNSDLIKKLNKLEIQKGYDFIASSNGISKDEYASKFGLADTTAKRQLKEMVNLGLVEMIGKSVNTKYIKK